MDGGVGGFMPPIFSDLQESWTKIRHAVRELATVFFVAFFLVAMVGRLVKTPPPQGRVFRLITGFTYSIGSRTHIGIVEIRGRPPLSPKEPHEQENTGQRAFDLNPYL